MLLTTTTTTTTSCRGSACLAGKPQAVQHAHTTTAGRRHRRQAGRQAGSGRGLSLLCHAAAQQLGCKLVGVGSCVPASTLTNADLAQVVMYLGFSGFLGIVGGGGGICVLVHGGLGHTGFGGVLGF